MKTDKKLVKVVATHIVGSGFSNLKTSTAKGISPLKRGQTMIDFISTFLTERGINTYSLHQRSAEMWATSPIMSLNQEPQVVITYNFVQFLSGDLGFHAKDLTASELERDMKHLKKIIHG